MNIPDQQNSTPFSSENESEEIDLKEIVYIFIIIKLMSDRFRTETILYKGDKKPPNNP